MDQAAATLATGAVNKGSAGNRPLAGEARLPSGRLRRGEAAKRGTVPTDRPSPGTLKQSASALHAQHAIGGSRGISSVLETYRYGSFYPNGILATSSNLPGCRGFCAVGAAFRILSASSWRFMLLRRGRRVIAVPVSRLRPAPELIRGPRMVRTKDSPVRVPGTCRSQAT